MSTNPLTLCQWLRATKGVVITTRRVEGTIIVDVVTRAGERVASFEDNGLGTYQTSLEEHLAEAIGGDLVVSSPASRAFSTAQLVAAATDALGAVPVTPADFAKAADMIAATSVVSDPPTSFTDALVAKEEPALITISSAAEEAYCKVRWPQGSVAEGRGLFSPRGVKFPPDYAAITARVMAVPAITDPWNAPAPGENAQAARVEKAPEAEDEARREVRPCEAIGAAHLLVKEWMPKDGNAPDVVAQINQWKAKFGTTTTGMKKKISGCLPMETLPAEEFLLLFWETCAAKGVGPTNPTTERVTDWVALQVITRKGATSYNAVTDQLGPARV